MIFICEIVRFKKYSSFQTKDETSGTSVDYAYEEFGIKLAYTFEFRDRGSYGFVLPANQIIPNGLEILDGLIGMVAESQRRGLL